MIKIGWVVYSFKLDITIYTWEVPISITIYTWEIQV
jgi:hypothetical protein